jgi:hypothetical protein
VAFLDVLGKNRPDYGSLVGADDQRLGRRVEGVAERTGACQPLAARGLALEPLADPVDQKPSLELSEDAQELQQHPADRTLGVDGLGCRPERHPGGIEGLHDGHEPDNRAGEPIDPVDEQDVELAGPGCCERRLKPGPLQRRA